jgi:hypothetical protein
VKEQLWRRWVAKRSRLGLSVREFCEQEGLKESAFYFWRRELARRDAETAAGRAPESRGRGTSQRLTSGGRRRRAFLPVTIGSPASELERDASAGTIEVRFPEGITLSIRSGVDAAMLGIVLQAVRG